MREELIKILNNKLNDINEDIKTIIDLNNRIDGEKEKSSFADKILGLFNENSDDNYMNFVKIEKDDFDKALDLVGTGVKDVFTSDSCNYDGLVYLINGINNGISLVLTDEQKNGIKYFVDALGEKKKEFDSAIDGYTLVKSRYEINDVDELNKKKDEYTNVIDDVNGNSYVNNIDLLKEAIKFSNLSSEDTINLLTYVLEYNSNLYKEGKEVSKKEEVEVSIPEINIPKVEEKEEDLPKFEEPDDDKFNELNDFHFNDIENDKLFDLPDITFDDDKEEQVEVSVPEEEKKEEVSTSDYQEYTPFVENNEEVETSKEEVNIEEEKEELPEVEETVEEQVEVNVPEIEPEVEEEKPLDLEESNEEVEEQVEVQEENNEIDNDFSDIISSNEDYENNETVEEEKTSTRELQKIFGKYGIEENIVLNELIDGNVNEYQNTLDSLKDHNVLEHIKGNKELLVEILLNSNTEVIDKALKIIKEDLSVDDEDYVITSKIAINTIPSIFVKDGGNYDNFIKNVELFKELEINLINLFDFSKEIFVADNENIRKNLDVVNKYDFDINYKNAKYFLLIPYIADKLDYYIESVYEDKLKKETFDGINYIKEYTAKLNVVTDETIKRLRYSSENGKKVFGSKPGSLSGEITNLRVNALDISSDYLSKFFNNEFTSITPDEVREYVKLVHNSSNVGDYSDELDKLKDYRDGLRYNIEGIKVSYNKVLRNYSVLRSYGIDTKKALQFAVCYNLVITKDEYNKLNDLLDKIGGNV